jgi:hypothetical protein
MGGGAPMAPHPPGPPGGTGGAMAPGAMLGQQAKAMEGVKLGLKALQEALPSIPIGSELHQAVLKAVGDIGKHIDQGGPGDQSGMMQQLVQMARSAQGAPPQAAAMQRAFPTAPPPAGGGAPPPAMAA